MDLESRPYVLAAHRGMSDPPTFYLAQPTAGDVMAARSAATSVYTETETVDPGEGKAKRSVERRRQDVDMDALGVEMVARSLRRVDNLTRGGVPMVVPTSGDLADRIAFVRQLPYSWLGELGAASQQDADLDSEEERGASAVRSGDGGGEVGDVRLRTVQAGDAA